MSSSDAPQDTPPGYTGWSAEDKRNWLFEELLSATEYGPVDRPEPTQAAPWTMASVAVSPTTLARTLDHDQDMMEPDRPKIIHAQGAVAMVELETFENSRYTGVLAPPPAGGATGLVRISLAVPAVGRGSITPGMGLKLLVDTKPSLDLLAMNHTVGQGRDFNLFSNTFSHDLSDQHRELRTPQKILGFFFERVTNEPRRLTIDHFAATQRDGSEVADPVVPERIVFRPHLDVKRSVYADAHGEDFRDPLLRIEPGARLWNVEAIPPGEPNGEPETIGVLRTISRFTCSAGGDRLFFRHHVDEASRLV